MATFLQVRSATNYMPRLGQHPNFCLKGAMPQLVLRKDGHLCFLFFKKLDAIRQVHAGDDQNRIVVRIFLIGCVGLGRQYERGIGHDAEVYRGVAGDVGADATFPENAEELRVMSMPRFSLCSLTLAVALCVCSTA